jgi:hypothetical protein
MENIYNPKFVFLAELQRSSSRLVLVKGGRVYVISLSSLT